MTTKAAFTTDEWDLVRSGPPAAGMMVIAASHGGMIRETFEMAKVYADARGQHGDSELLDELKENSVRLLGEIIELLTAKATPEEVADYRAFILTLTERVAKRHKEDGVEVSPAEQGAIDDVRAALG